MNKTMLATCDKDDEAKKGQPIEPIKRFPIFFKRRWGNLYSVVKYPLPWHCGQVMCV